MSYRTARPRVLRRAILLFVLICVCSLAPTLSTSQAQTDIRYFPETGHSLRGAFRIAWENNGNVTVFGYPITEEYVSPTTGRVTQYFERARFELIMINDQPYVELGRLGSEITEARIFPKVPPIENTEDRRYVAETEHIVQYGFKTIWERYGEARIFGYPISEEIEEQFPDGVWRTVQYFERARFEYWPERADGDRVLITNLGRVLAPPELVPPIPPEAIPNQPLVIGEPPVSEFVLPDNINAQVVPDRGQPGTVFAFDAFGFEPGEKVGVWVTAPDQSTFDGGFEATANSDGSIVDEGIALFTNETFPEGIWSFNAEGIDSGVQAVGYFLISWDAPPPESQPTDEPPAVEQPAGPDPTLPEPSFDDCEEDPNFANAANFPVLIVGVNKETETATLRNASNEPIDLTGWRLCSLRGSEEQSGIGGVIQSGEVRDFTQDGDEIWSDDNRDDAALYNSFGQLVSYWTDTDDSP
jgi:hypothetical protein